MSQSWGRGFYRYVSSSNHFRRLGMGLPVSFGLWSASISGFCFVMLWGGGGGAVRVLRAESVFDGTTADMYLVSGMVFSGCLDSSLNIERYNDHVISFSAW
ncbi:hypothetical protein Tco_0873450 [Tanacetum coccineum]|uniref:Uncharacterized protein n=1 Tax=Tanacetum coccineum TaxID=301880 RepID=A0ABQ5BMZ2_9ASTR